jgi:hypothetical protein
LAQVEAERAALKRKPAVRDARNTCLEIILLVSVDAVRKDPKVRS